MGDRLHAGALLDAIGFDVRHSVRSLGRSPGFVLVFIATIGLSFGAAIATASLLEAIVLRTVSAPDPNRLVSIAATDARTNRPGTIYTDTYLAYREAARSLTQVSMYTSRYFRVEARGQSMDGHAEGVTPEYFAALGATPAQGRLFTDADAASPVVVLSDRFRRRLFGDDVAVIGETIKVEGNPVTIAGVAAPGFQGLQFDGGIDLVLPIAVMHAISGSNGPPRGRNLIARLAPGATLTEARAELLARWPAAVQETLPAALSASEQRAARAQQVDIESIQSGFSALRLRYGNSIVLLLGLSLVLLVVAGVNLTGLLLVRSLGQRHQIAVRLAVGASRARAAGQILFEGVLLALTGFLVSVPIAWWTTRALNGVLMFGRTTPLMQSLTPNAVVLAAAAAAALLIGLAVASLPACRGVSAARAEALHSGRAIAGTLGRTGRLLLVVQVALSMILLVGTGLFASTLSKLRSNSASVQARNVVFTRLARLPGDRRPITPDYFPALVGGLAAGAGVRSAALSVYFPTYFQFPDPVPTDRYARADLAAGAEIGALTEFVSPRFFETFGIARLGGRDFTWADNGESAPVVIVTQSVASALFAGDAVGRRLRLPGPAVREFEIVGVVADAPFGTIREPRQPTVFRPIVQDPSKASAPMAHVQFEGDVQAVGEGYKRAVASQGRHLVSVLFTFEDFTNSVLLKERMAAWLSSFVSLLIVALACIGVYSMLAYAVASRVREIGIRVAVGATRGAIVRLILREGVMVAAAGVAIGIAGAWAAGRLVQSQLYGVAAGDPAIVTAAAAALVLTVAAASAVPAWRAARIQPTEALRQD